MARAGGVGGAAAEQGSLHRSGVAAYLAVHGLVGDPVDDRAGAVPVRIQLEAAEAVDDIVCTMEDGSTWYIQCKRVAGNDAALRSAIGQWVKQDLEPGDRIVLSSRQLRGILNDLQSSLDRLADDDSAPIARRKLEAVNTLTELLEAAGAPDGQALLPRVLLLKCAVEGRADTHQGLATAMLADTLVARGDAAPSFEALRNAMQQAAADRRGTDLHDWVEAISRAGIRVFDDAKGAPGARAEAERKSQSAYRAALARDLDTLDLSGLAPMVGPLHMEDLLGIWTVEWDRAEGRGQDRMSANLYPMVRRNRRFVVTGPPGIGKSTALRQIAANLAAHPLAPLPIHVDLRDLLAAVGRADDITADLILHRAAQVAAASDPDALVGALRRSLRSGDTVLIVDGLDESRQRRGMVARGIRQLLDSLPPDTGLVLSTRPGAADAVAQLEVPVVQLRPPERLTESLDLILTELSAREAPDTRANWLAQRRAALNDAAKGATEIWTIPLLASLAVLRIAKHGHDSAASPADLLSSVITDSIKAWEELKAAHRDGFDAELRAEMLADGYVAIGRLLNERATAPVSDAERAVTAALRRWGHAEPLTALLAQQVIHFWDERVGIFVENDGHLAARSRQFAELADVQWVTAQGEQEKREWLRVAAADPDRRHTVRLATSGDASIRQALIDLSQRGQPPQLRERAVAWLADMWSTWSCLDENTARAIIGVLADAAEDTLPSPQSAQGILRWIEEPQRSRDGGGWHCVISLLRADLPAALVQARDERLGRLRLSEPRRRVVVLITGLSRAQEEGRQLTAQELAYLEQILAGPRPAPVSMSRRPDGVYALDNAERFITGIGDIVKLAVDHLDQLPPHAPDAFYAIGRRLPRDVFSRVTQVLSAKGHPDPDPPLADVESMFASLEKTFSDFHGHGWMLRQVSSMSPEDVAASPIESWRCGQLATFFTALALGTTSIPAWRSVMQEDPAVLRTWFDATSEAHQLDLGLIATQARRILADPNDSNGLLEVVTTSALEPLEPSRRLDCTTASALTAVGFASKSTWIAERTFNLVLDSACPGVAQAVAKLPGPLPWRSRLLATAAALANTDDRDEWIDRTRNGDSAQRSALAAILPQFDGGHDAIAAALAGDTDATVRHFAKAPTEGSTEWTCTWCYAIRDIQETPCSECQQHPEWTT